MLALINVTGLSSNITATPDLPLNMFVSGKLGVLNPNLGPSYLLVVYRYLINIICAWISAQQAIFSHLTDPNNYYNEGDQSKIGSTASDITKALAAFPAQLPPAIQDEKIYFQAAANFYTKDPSLILQASQQFFTLGHDKNYPWPDWAIYLGNRALALAAFRQQTIEMQNNTNATIMFLLIVILKNLSSIKLCMACNN